MTRSIFLTGLVAVLLSLGAYAQTEAPDPSTVAQRVAERLVANTEFELKPRAMNPVQQGYVLVHLPGADAGYMVFTGLELIDPTAETSLRLSHSAGTVSIYADEELVLESKLDSDGHVREVDYGVALGDAQTAEPIPNDTTGVLLHFVPNDPGPAWLALGVAGANLQRDTAAHHFVSPIGVEHPAVYRVLADGNLPNDAPGLLDDSWRVPVVPVVSAIAEPLAYSDFRYFTGATLTALAEVSAHFDDLDYSDYIASHAKFFLSNVDAVAVERRKYHLIGSAFGHYFRFQLLDDVGPQSAALSVWAADAPNSEMKKRAEDIMRRAAKQVMSGVRLDDGTFARITPRDKSVWADDLFMGGLSLVHLSRYFDEPALLDEAATQAMLIDKNLKDEATGIYWHGYFADIDEHSSSKWGRANGWTMVAKAIILEALPQDDTRYEAVLKAFHDHAEALLKVQSDDGRWHQVLDKPDTYLETSVTAMFTYAFAAGVAKGWLPDKPYAAAAEKGWAALNTQIDEDGKVEGIVRGTPIFFSDDSYQDHAPRTDDPRGLGAILYATVAIDRMRNVLER